MVVNFTIALNKEEIDTLDKASAILDYIVNAMEEYRSREIITDEDYTYDRSFIDEAAGMLQEMAYDNITLNQKGNRYVLYGKSSLVF